MAPGLGGADEDIVGNYYCTQAADAWDALERFCPRLDELEGRTRLFLETFLEADLAPVVKEAALFNLSTLGTQTFFRTADGNPFGWEGCLTTPAAALAPAPMCGTTSWPRPTSSRPWRGGCVRSSSATPPRPRGP